MSRDRFETIGIHLGVYVSVALAGLAIYTALGG